MRLESAASLAPLRTTSTISAWKGKVYFLRKTFPRIGARLSSLEHFSAVCHKYEMAEKLVMR
jgi:hypothetical protein